jgi:ribose-phosphate pyrophosphokinase
MLIFTGNANKPLTEEIIQYIDQKPDYHGIKLGDALVSTFSDGEIQVEIRENVRGRDVFVVQPTAPPARNIMELILMVDALKRASARRITVVMPYYGYGRQDRKAKPRVPVSARKIADMIENAGTDRVLAMDLHSPQIQGFFKIPLDNLYGSYVFLPYLLANYNNYIEEEKLVLVSPDAGGTDRVRYYKDRLKNVSMAIIDKRREQANMSEVMHVIGDVAGKVAIIFDDMVDTGGTTCKAADALHNHGAVRVIGMASHAVLSGPAIQKINDSLIENMIFTNTLDKHIENDKFIFLSVAKLIGEGILSVHEERSVSGLFK